MLQRIINNISSTAINKGEFKTNHRFFIAKYTNCIQIWVLSLFTNTIYIRAQCCINNYALMRSLLWLWFYWKIFAYKTKICLLSASAQYNPILDNSNKYITTFLKHSTCGIWYNFVLRHQLSQQYTGKLAKLCKMYKLFLYSQAILKAVLAVNILSNSQLFCNSQVKFCLRKVSDVMK